MHPLMDKIEFDRIAVISLIVSLYEREEISIGAACEYLGLQNLEFRQLRTEVDFLDLRAERLLQTCPDLPFTKDEILKMWRVDQKPEAANG